MQPNEANNESQTTEPAQKPAGSKKLLYGILAAIGLLLVILIVLVTMLLMKDPAPEDASNKQSVAQSASSEDTDNPNKKVVRTFSTNNPKLELRIYEPEQKSTNTTLYFGIRNTCDKCEDTTYANGHAILGSGYKSQGSAYILDESVGQKYEPIVNEDGDVLASPTCAKHLHGGKTLECFIAFNKVPSGSSVSLVLDNIRVDNLLVP